MKLLHLLPLLLLCPDSIFGQERLVRKREGPLPAAVVIENKFERNQPAETTNLTKDEEQFLRFLQEQSSHSFSYAPSAVPSKAGTTKAPTESPSTSPTESPSKSPTTSPSKSPTESPSKSRTKSPTESPSKEGAPTKSPSNVTPSPTKSSAPTDTACLDDQTFSYSENSVRTCANIDKQQFRRDIYCRYAEVQEACERTCGQCCYDSPDFSFVVRGDNKSCLWIKKKAIRVGKYCGVEDGNGLLVQDHCPEACEICREKTTVVPTRSPIASSTCENDSNWNFADSPKVTCKWIRNKEKRRQKFCPKPGIEDACPQACGVCCENDVAYRFDVNEVPRDCDWVSSPINRQTTYCDTFQNDKMVRDACPVACNRCLSTVTPAPTPSTSTPATPSPTPITPATPDPTPSTPATTPSPTDICLNDDSWNWFGSPKVTCKWIRSKESRREKFCSKASGMQSCPQTCGICCMDDPSYTFEVRDKNRSCPWVGKKDNRKSTYCDTRQNGDMVRNACPEACGACLDPPIAS